MANVSPTTLTSIFSEKAEIVIQGKNNPDTINHMESIG